MRRPRVVSEPERSRKAGELGETVGASLPPSRLRERDPCAVHSTQCGCDFRVNRKTICGVTESTVPGYPSRVLVTKTPQLRLRSVFLVATRLLVAAGMGIVVAKWAGPGAGLFASLFLALVLFRLDGR